MTNAAVYQPKIARLSKWFTFIASGIKKDLKQDHLRLDNIFCRQYFKTTNVSKLSLQEMIQGYSIALKNPAISESLAEFIVNRWLLNHTEIYEYFESSLLSISEDVFGIKKITLKDSRRLIKEASLQFGALPTLVFSIFNELQFPEKAFFELEQSVEKQENDTSKILQEEAENASWQKRVDVLEREMTRQKDRYEKKICGLQRLYQKDVACLKKQVACLQKKLFSEEE